MEYKGKIYGKVDGGYVDLGISIDTFANDAQVVSIGDNEITINSKKANACTIDTHRGEVLPQYNCVLDVDNDFSRDSCSESCDNQNIEKRGDCQYWRYYEEIN